MRSLRAKAEASTVTVSIKLRTVETRRGSPICKSGQKKIEKHRVFLYCKAVSLHFEKQPQKAVSF